MFRIIQWLAFLAVIAFQSQVNAADSKPPVRWEFSAEETTRLEPHGGVHRDVPGPRPPQFPNFAADNLAVKLDGNGAHFSADDAGVESPFDFTNGGEISLEAWVQIDDIRSGGNVYIIGKGRTGSPNFPADNQN